MENLTLTELVALLENEESTILKTLIQDEIENRLKQEEVKTLERK